MTMDLHAVQQDIKNYLEQEVGLVVYDTAIPSTNDEPSTSDGIPTSYIVIRFSDSWPSGSGSLGGARLDEMYTIIDVLVVSPDPGESREIAYGADGVKDILTGYTPIDSGEMSSKRGTRSYVVGDGTTAKPRRFISTVSFSVPINTIAD